MTERDLKEGIQLKLTRVNYPTWIVKIKDYILSLDHDDAADIWNAFQFVQADPQNPVADPADHDYQLSTVNNPNGSLKKLRVQHNKAFRFIRNSLSEELFNTTLHLPTSVPKLLRHLRSKWNDGTVSDRDKLRVEYTELKLSSFVDLEAYITAFKNQVVVCKRYNLGLVDNEEDILFQFNKGLPNGWSMHKSIAMAQQMKYEAALSYYVKVARDDSSLPGSLVPPSKRKADSVHTTTEVCRNFAKGICKRGDDCKYHHPSQPSSGGSFKESRKCYHCGKAGHLKSQCFKLKNAKNNKAKGGNGSGAGKGSTDRSHVTTNDDDSSGYNQDDDQDIGDVRVDDCSYMTREVSIGVNGCDEVFANLSSFEKNKLTSKMPKGDLSAKNGSSILMAIDGASTTAVVQDAKHCKQVRATSRYIKTGGEGRPTLIHCKQEGILPIDTVVDGRHVVMNVPCRIVPGFGIDVLPECFFLKKKCKVIKSGAEMEVRTPDNKVILRGEALKYDNSWLFYSKVDLNVNGGSSSRSSLAAIEASPTISVESQVYVSYSVPVEEGEDEARALLPLSDEHDKCYSTSQGKPPSSKESINAFALAHRRFGHRNYRDTAEMEGIPIPTGMPACIDCIKGKSKRRPLTGGGEPIHDGIRPGYAWVWDHCGPFRVRSWGGNNTLSLKSDVFSGKLMPKMVVSTGGCHEEWSQHVAQLEAHFGRRVVSRMITDSAPYFEDRRLENFNKSQGIIHVQSPPYTQELNGLIERELGTILGMTRTDLDTACAPDGACGECILAMCFVLDRLLHRRGGKLSRLEKWHGRLIPNQRDRLKVWGCAAYVHLDFGPRGKIDGYNKMGSKAKLYMFVGYDENGMGYRVASLPDFKVRTTVHVTFVEDVFPCKTSLTRQLGPLGFLTEEQERRLPFEESSTVPPVDDVPIDARRSGRQREPSAAALEAIANGPPSAPDEVHSASCVDDALCRKLDEAFPEYYDNVHATADDCPSTVPEALQSVHADEWKEALNREVSQHEKNGTFGPPVSAKDLPAGTKAIPFDCILKVKRDGTHKVRGIIKGYRMKEGVDFNETFAPVPCISVLRLLLILAVLLGWCIVQGDVHTAFLSADMDTLVYVIIYNWFKCNATGKETGFTIRKLLKGVPGIPQGSRLFHKKVHAIFTSLGLVQCKSEFCLYFCLKRKLYLIIWVDDIFLFFPKSSSDQAKQLWDNLRQKLELDEWQEIDDCLGCVVRYDREQGVLTLSQEKAVKKLLEKNKLDDCKEVTTPMVPNSKLSKAQCPTREEAAVMVDEQRWYRSTVASLIYFVSWTRPDMAYTVSKLCKFMHNPGREHIVALKRALRYLKGTANYGLKFSAAAARSRNTKLGMFGYFDASHADCPDTLKSTLAYLFFLAGCPVSWLSKLHSYITTATNHSEYCAGAKAAKEAKYWEKVLTEIGFERYVKPIDLFSDNKGCIAMAYNPVLRSASKHVDLADHYVREQQERGTITISYVSTKEMTADIFTKPLGTADFQRHCASLIHSL